MHSPFPTPARACEITEYASIGLMNPTSRVLTFCEVVFAVSISDALSSLASSSCLISSLPFRRTQTFSTAVLAPEDWFEHHLLRDSEPHENALFTPADHKFDPAAEDHGPAAGDKWTAAKRKGPKRAAGQGDLASPLKEKGKTQDSLRCLRAAEKLLAV